MTVPAFTQSVPVHAAMRSYFDYLRQLVNRGGPEPAEYAELNACWAAVNRLRREGVIAWVDIEDAWRRLGDAFWSCNTMQGFVILKPHGYAGDFEIIERIHREWVSTEPHWVNWDHFFHVQAGPRAVRNRRRYFHDMLQEMVEARPQHPVHVLNLGCGSARETFEWFSKQNSKHISFECIDNDPKAIAYASALCRPFLHSVKFAERNVLKFASDTKYDLIWSAGLFDYFSNRTFTILLKRYLPLLRTGGQMIIGNFSASNPMRDYMECGNWMLCHRTEEELVALAKACGISEDRIAIGKEPEGVNLFLHIRCD